MELQDHSAYRGETRRGFFQYGRLQPFYVELQEIDRIGEEGRECDRRHLDDRGRPTLVPGLLNRRVAPGAGFLITIAREEGDRSHLRGQGGMDRSHVVETIMRDVLAQQGEGDRVCLQSHYTAVG